MPSAGDMLDAGLGILNLAVSQTPTQPFSWTANSTPHCRLISIPTAARLQSANGKPSASGV